MRAVVIDNFGGRDVLQLKDIPRPVPGEGEVLVRIHAAGVNPVDWKIRVGRYKERGYPHEFPVILGWDMAGVVEGRGHAARRFNVGDKVYGYCRRPVIGHGTYAEYISLPESYLSLKPEKISMLQAAGVPLAALTAYQSLLVAAKLKKKETLLVIGASGGVGSFALQLARIAGARVIGVASGKNHAYLKSLGARYAIDHARQDMADELKRIAPGGADVVFSCVGGEPLRTAYDCVKKGGRLVTIVERGDEALARSKGIKLLYVFVEPDSRQLERVSELIDKKKIRVRLSKIYLLEEAAKAHEQIETAHTRGKIVLKCL